MTKLLTKRALTSVLALGMAASATAYAPAAAFASTQGAKAPAKAAACTKAQVGKTKTSGKTTWVCEKSGKSYKWVKKTKK